VKGEGGEPIIPPKDKTCDLLLERRRVRFASAKIGTKRRTRRGEKGNIIAILGM